MSMRFQRLLLVVNPVARTMSKPVLAVIEKALSADFRLEVAETKERGHASELAAHCKAKLSGPKVPRDFVFVDALPRNPTGKVLKHELRSTYS